MVFNLWISHVHVTAVDSFSLDPQAINRTLVKGIVHFLMNSIKATYHHRVDVLSCLTRLSNIQMVRNL
jgi:hypothetical protein